MTVQILRLASLEPAEAEQAADQLIDLDTGPPDLSNLLVLDDTALLVQHGPVYGTLDTSRRVENMLCVAVGPRTGTDGVLRLPGNLGGSQGSPVLWVSYPSGIDWRAAAGAVAKGHQPGKGSGLDILVELLSGDDMFSLVRSALNEKVPGRVANPGLHLAGADDEAATFAAALAVAIGRLCEPGPGAGGPFPALLPSRAGGATLAEGVPLARYRDEVRESVAAASDVLRNRGGLGGMLRQGDDRVREHLVEAGAALADLRNLVTTLLREASTLGELTANQRRQLMDAGIRFPAGPAPSSSAQTAGSAAEQRPVYQTIVEAVRGGDTFALVARRLTLTERELKRRGSASYLPEVATCCPPPLLDRLTAPPQRLPRRVTAETWQELGIEGATQAVQELEELVLTVANREWSPAATTPGEVARMRVALDGVCKALTEHAGAAGSAGSGARGARLARLGDSLTPVLRDLALRVLAAESAQPSAGGQEAFGSARERARARIAEWVQHVQVKGVSSPPPFASSSAPGVVLHADDDDVGEIREALRYRPVEQMWQLCAPKDLGALSVGVTPEVVRFAPRWSRDALVGTLAEDQPVWTSSGAYAGLLRLVPLRPSYLSSSWSDASAVEPAMAEPPMAEPSVAEPSVAQPSGAEPSVAEPS